MILIIKDNSEATFNLLIDINILIEITEINYINKCILEN